RRYPHRRHGSGYRRRAHHCRHPRRQGARRHHHRGGLHRGGTPRGHALAARIRPRHRQAPGRLHHHPEYGTNFCDTGRQKRVRSGIRRKVCPVRLTIKTKLAAVFTTVVALSGISMFLALQWLGAINQSMATVIDGPVARSQQLKTIEVNLTALSNDMRAMVLSTDDAELAALQASIEQNY